MLNIPPNLIPYLSTLNQLNKCGIVQEIQFSGPTYQIKIVDPHQEEDIWTFIQLNKAAEVTDAFCSCRESEEHGGCSHLALSYVSLFDGSNKPIHERFQRSFWYAIGKIWFERYGPNLKTPGFKATASSEEGTRLLELIKGEKIAETEENSIKFSNLSEEEIANWKEGNPSFDLLFELSGWADFVKQLFLHKHLQIEFLESPKMLPKEVVITSTDFTIKSSLKPEDLKSIIPSLHESHSNLSVFNQLKDGYSSITYDAKRSVLSLIPKSLPAEVAGALEIGDWIYIPKEGFYSKVSLVKDNQMTGDAIGDFFDQYGDQVELLLKNDEWHSKPLPLQYALKFDKEWNLEIRVFLLKSRDLEKSHRWGRWVYIPGGGFYSVLASDSFDIPSKILQKDVSDFIRDHSDWLMSQKGFTVHLSNIETQVSYHIDEQGALTFERKLPHKGASSVEFGPWIYVKGEGFFSKTNAPVFLPVEFGVPIRKELVSSFIIRNAFELDGIPGFFAKEDPFQKVGLEIGMEKESKIWVEPRYTFKEKYKKSTPLFYDDWVYFEGDGFFQITGANRLPEKVREPLWIPSDEVAGFIENELDDLEPWIQKIDPRLVPPVYMRLILNQLEESQYYSWVLDLYYQTEQGKIPVKALIEAIHKRKKYLFLPEGRLNLSDERFQWIRRLRPESIVEKHKLNLSTIELIRLHAFEDIGASLEATALFQEVIELKKTPPFNCDELKSALRPYQQIGAEWLFSLYHYMLGGLLCDEMGLGKTHQSMALIAALRKLKPNSKFLVACPTSVLYHWEDKLRDFFPTLTIMTHHGTLRRKDEPIDADLFLTSYGILRSDIDWIKKHKFDVAFYDEIQVAKNHRSKLYLSLKQVAADVKIGLTGTPLENKLRELKALFDLVLPGYMPHETDYNRLIVRPIEKMRDMARKSLLQRLTHPFILRRKKIDVLRDLPVKTETIAHCELSQEQDQLYRETLLVQGDVLLQEIMDVKKAVPFLHVFSLLSRLKQICDHPALYLKETDSFDQYQSGKWDLFVELLQEARESQQKVVVYSQYLGMLDIIEKYLKSEGIGYASLRGSTRDRKEQIALFATDPTCEVFVASLKAAGLGIDLTSASVVIHYDRWWNAARENQATDRVHRYGQSRGVQVFKLVTKNTFEERIDQIIERKKDLLDAAVAFDDHEVMKSFTRDELFELLQYHR